MAKQIRRFGMRMNQQELTQKPQKVECNSLRSFFTKPQLAMTLAGVEHETQAFGEDALTTQPTT